jgi:hypothetical protein
MIAIYMTQSAFTGDAGKSIVMARVSSEIGSPFSEILLFACKRIEPVTPCGKYSPALEGDAWSY